MAVPADPITAEEEVEDGSPTHHPSAPSHEFFDLSTTVDPSYIISLIRKLLPLDSASRSTFREVASENPNRGGEEEEEDAPSVSVSNDENVKSSRSKSENMDVDVSAEFLRGECEGTDVSVWESAWEEYGCVLWDLAASKTHAELMVDNLILEVLLGNLLVCKSARVTEISIGIIGNLACHEVPMKHIISTKGLMEIIIDKLFLDDPQCLYETCRLLTAGLQSRECTTWGEALQSEHVLCQILWIAENTLNHQLLEKEICSSTELFQLICDLVKFPDKVEVGNCCVTAVVLIANMLSDVPGHASRISQDLNLLGGLLDIFPFASDDVEARNALWNVIARILVRIREPEMSLSRVHHYVSVLVTKLDLIEDELLNQQVESGDEQHNLCSPGSAANARNASLGMIISILNNWTAKEENAKNNRNAEVPVSETDVKRLLDCCHKFFNCN
ncbi:uncharacterized protein LOC108334463 isoform X2 [Vigna angularis]|uniref:uncharacterized protein LOC108334463 isoform X2 n=1 Tax=Phaseolus angularis TaxID=3914 RepID=UPI0022B501D0|nr:uncharacterized protein LOC108334463 isoform X2 [Vigna angularis]